MKKNFLTYFFIVVVVIAIVALFGPQEKSLGANVRIVYLHAAWVLTAEIVLTLAGLAGFVGLLLSREIFHSWSASLGRTGMVFWLTYLPLSLWAMDANWNGLFLSEPRFRLAVTFAVTGLLLQLGLWFLNTNWITSLGNLIFIVVLRVVFANAKNIMHPPPSPIFNSGLWNVILFFVALNLLAWLAAYFMTRWFHTLSGSPSA